MMGDTYVDDIQNAVLLFSNPVWSGDGSIPSTVIKNITALSSSIAYSADVEKNITILTSKYASTSNGVIQGLMYIPDLDTNDPCKELESSYVPSTAVRQANLPPSDYNLIALVPWYNATCTLSYLTAASIDPLRGFITYIPDNSTEKPPSAEAEIWNLHDHGAWRENTRFPVYAVSGSVGMDMMKHLGEYSGNVSSVPYGDSIMSLYGPSEDDYVRIWSEIHISTPNTLPTIWVFILVCIGVLLVFVAIVSCLMHYIQRRRRLALHQRVTSGQVNLEAMNIKRVRVPMEHVEKFPLFTYNYEPKHASLPSSPTSPRIPPSAAKLGMSGPLVSETALASPTARSTITGITINSTSTDYQPRCTICLEEYENRVTIIRELPCGHIYHPECIDEFLSENSSLCPQCKTSMLPPGYCPDITNAMVRRERALRRLRGQIVVEEGELGDAQNWRSNLKKKMFRPSSNAANAVQRVPTLQNRGLTVETRRRMRDLAGAETDDGRSWDGRPKWRKMVRSVFPGFR